MGISPLLAPAARPDTAGVDRYFIVDWVLPAAQLVDLPTAQRALDEAGRRLTADGHRVRCIHSTFVPAQRRWLCVFSADCEDTVRKTHAIAQLPVPRVEPAVHLTPLDHEAG